LQLENSWTWCITHGPTQGLGPPWIAGHGGGLSSPELGREGVSDHRSLPRCTGEEEEADSVFTPATLASREAMRLGGWRWLLDLVGATLWPGREGAESVRSSGGAWAYIL
jgi:hypothetical protein